jgi:hypothetical protein
LDIFTEPFGHERLQAGRGSGQVLSGNGDSMVPEERLAKKEARGKTEKTGMKATSE